MISSASVVSVVVEILAVCRVGVVPVTLEVSSLILAMRVLIITVLRRVRRRKRHSRCVRPHHHALETKPIINHFEATYMQEFKTKSVGMAFYRRTWHSLRREHHSWASWISHHLLLEHLLLYHVLKLHLAHHGLHTWRYAYSAS